MTSARKLLAMLPFLVGISYAASPTPGDLPLPEKLYPALDAILHAAVQQSPRMLNQTLDLEIAEADRISARSGMLPSVGGYLSEQRTREKRANPPGPDLSLDTNKTGYNFAITQPIYYWGQRKNTARMGEIREKMAHGQYRDGYRLLAQEIRAQYLQLVVAKLTLVRSRFYRQFTQDQLKIAEEKYTKKIISDAQISDSRLTTERGDIGLERAQFEYDNSKQSLARLAGVPVPEDDSIPDQLPRVAYQDAAYDQMLAEFLSQKDPPTLSAFTLRKQMELEDLNYKIQKTRLRPTFAFSMGDSQDEQRYTLNTPKFLVNDIYAGITLNWTLFDGFATSAAVRTSLAHRRQLENSYKALTEQLAAQAQWQRKMIYFAARGMSIDDRALDAGEGNFRNKQEEFKRGDISEADLSQIRLELYDIQTNAYRTRMDVLMKVVEFLGLLSEDPVVANLSVPAS